MRSAIMVGVAIGLLVAIVEVLLQASTRQAYACSAPAPPPLIEVLEGSDLAFVGEVVSIDRQEIQGEAHRRFEDIIEFKTREVWKGEPYETMFALRTWDLTPPSPPSPCPPSPSFAVSVSYIVFVSNGRTHLSMNSSTQQLTYSVEDEVATLGIGKTPIPGTVSPIPERQGLPVETQSGGSCNLVPVNGSGSNDMSAVGLGILLVWFWLRRRARR